MAKGRRKLPNREIIAWIEKFYWTQARLPKIREVAAKFHISPNTAMHKIQEARFQIMTGGLMNR